MVSVPPPPEHRIAGIHREVDDHFRLPRVGADRSQVPPMLDHQLHSLAEHALSRCDTSDTTSGSCALAGEASAARNASNLPGQPRRPVGVRLDLLDVVVSLSPGVWRISIRSQSGR